MKRTLVFIACLLLAGCAAGRAVVAVSTVVEGDTIVEARYEFGALAAAPQPTRR